MPEKWTGELVGKMHVERVTYRELAAELGVTRAYISMILSGKRRPDGARERMEAALERIVSRKSAASA